jgi:hypothetical protein
MTQQAARRRLTLLDMMALVAATAVGLALASALQPRNQDLGQSARFVALLVASQQHGAAVERAVSLTAPLFAFWTLALTVLRLRGPGKVPIGSPGPAACVSTSLVLMAGLPLNLMTYTPPGHPWVLALWTGGSWAGFVVIAVWGVLALRGQWRPESNWIDRAGRVVGLYWIAVYIATRTTS